MPGQYKITDKSGTRTYGSYSEARKKNRPNILQRAMLMMNRAGRGAGFGVGRRVAKAADTRAGQLKTVNKQLDKRKGY